MSAAWLRRSLADVDDLSRVILLIYLHAVDADASNIPWPATASSFLKV